MRRIVPDHYTRDLPAFEAHALAAMGEVFFPGHIIIKAFMTVYFAGFIVFFHLIVNRSARWSPKSSALSDIALSIDKLTASTSRY
jgi:hypothetical protein